MRRWIGRDEGGSWGSCRRLARWRRFSPLWGCFAFIRPSRSPSPVSSTGRRRMWAPANITAAPTIITIQGADPRNLAVSADGSRVYAAIFQSQNATGVVRQQDVTNPAGPYGGQNPPPNSGGAFNPPLAVGLPPG